MAFRLGSMIVEGELNNTKKNSTHGRIRLRGHKASLAVDLTGDCDPDLAGKRFRFEARPGADPTPGGDIDLKGLAWHQIGPTGDMTAARIVKTFDCPIEELMTRSKLGEPPPFERKRCLYLEWFSQNGRVVIELADPIITFVDEDGKEQVSEHASPLPPEIDALEPPGTLGLGVTAVSRDETGAWHAESEVLGLDDEEDYDEEAEDPLYELELMDDLIENSDGEPIGGIFAHLDRLPQADSLSDDKAERLLKRLLGELALYGIALHVCEHFTPRDAYRLLVETIAREESFHPELRGTGWVQNFMTAEFCPACEAKIQAEFEAEDPPSDQNS